MAGSWLVPVLDPNHHAFFNFTLVLLLKSCHPPDPHSVENKDSVSKQFQAEEEGAAPGIFEDLFNWLGLEAETEVLDHDIGRQPQSKVLFKETDDKCIDVINTTINASSSIFTLLRVFASILVVVVTLFFGLKKVRSLWLRRKSPGEEQALVATRQSSETDETGDMKEDPKTDSADQNAKVQDVQETSNVPSKLQMPISIPFQRCNFAKTSPDVLIKTDVAQLLAHTVDHFLTELDRVLGMTAIETSPSAESLPALAAPSTPRVERKGSVRRPRWRSPNSLPFDAASVSPDDKTSVRMWQKVEEMSQRMRWHDAGVGDLDINVVQDNRLSAVLQFYQQTCPVRTEQWSGASLIVNYVLSLLENELVAGCQQNDPLKVVGLQSYGSAANKTCVGRPDRFDVMLVFRLQSCKEMSVFHWGICDEIPTGKLVLGLKEYTVIGNSSSQHFLIKDRIGDSFGLFLSQKEVVKAAQKLVLNALERIKSKNKAALERLPFTFRLASYDDLLLIIDTKMLNGMGLGVSKVSIHLTPSFRVSSVDSDPLPILYAVPPWGSSSSNDSGDTRHRLQSRILRNRTQGVPADLLWQLNCTELTKSFMATAENRLVSAGVWGCQIMCQQILRALFSHSGKDTLLTSGEVHPHILDTIVCFLLLESPFSAWDLHSLPDRLSDCVHFLRSAVQSAWMPDFTLHNPHLLKQMPALKLLPLLNVGRQENLLANVGPDAADTIQFFMDTRLQETGLRRCLKSEFSSEMWEYEFFIFG